MIICEKWLTAGMPQRSIFLEDEWKKSLYNEKTEFARKNIFHQREEVVLCDIRMMWEKREG